MAPLYSRNEHSITVGRADGAFGVRLSDMTHRRCHRFVVAWKERREANYENREGGRLNRTGFSRGQLV
jgi:hypothetical protein